jgi:hypothetical protein
MAKAKVEPITPSQAAKQKQQELPGEVIEAFNSMIALNFDGSSATVLQKDVVAKIMEKMGLRKVSQVKNCWLDIEPVFRAAGWSVKYDKPAYCESYDAYFVFERKSQE